MPRTVNGRAWVINYEARSDPDDIGKMFMDLRACEHWCKRVSEKRGPQLIYEITENGERFIGECG